MNHRFDRKEIQEGREWEWELCIYCGVQRQRHRSGRSLFRQADGTLASKAQPCRYKQLSQDDRVIPSAPVVVEKTQPEKLVTFPAPTCPKGTSDRGNKIFVDFGDGGKILPLRELPKEYAKANEAVRNRQFNNRIPPPGPERDAEINYLLGRGPKPEPVTQVEAQLKDAYIIINVLYEEMVTAGIRTPGRRMAGTLLHSAGYEGTVKTLQR